MARVRVAALLFAALLGFSGCSAFFEFNAFSSLGKPPAPKLSDYQGSGGLAKLAQDLSSAAVVAQLKADPGTTGQIETYLVDTYGAGLTTPTSSDEQTAAALYADLYLATTGGDQAVSNAVTAVSNQSSWSDDFKTVLTGIVPAAVCADHTAFAAMMNGFLAANSAYMQLGTSLGSSSVPQGMNMGEVAQQAAVAYVASFVVSQVDTQSGNIGPDAAIEQLYLLVNGQPNDITTNGETPPYNPLDPTSPDPRLQNIFSAAGLPYP